MEVEVKDDRRNKEEEEEENRTITGNSGSGTVVRIVGTPGYPVLSKIPKPPAQNDEDREARRYQEYLGGKKNKSKENNKPNMYKKKIILGKERCIYKIPGSRKDYVKYKGKFIIVKDFIELNK